MILRIEIFLQSNENVKKYSKTKFEILLLYLFIILYFNTTFTKKCKLLYQILYIRVDIPERQLYL